MILCENCHFLLLLLHILLSAMEHIIQNFWRLYLWCYWCYKHRISNTSSLAINLSSEIALELQLTSESCHKQTFSKFESIACSYISRNNYWYIIKHFEAFDMILTCCLTGKWWGKLYTALVMIYRVWIHLSLIIALWNVIWMNSFIIVCEYNLSQNGLKWNLRSFKYQNIPGGILTNLPNMSCFWQLSCL